MSKIAALTAILVFALPSVALADGDGAVKGGVGGAVAGALVGGPVGAAVGGVAGMAIGGAASGPDQTVVVQPSAPCRTRTTQTTDNTTGASSTTQTTNCPN
jgi:hypothetical protein